MWTRIVETRSGIVQQIVHRGRAIDRLSDDELFARSQNLRFRAQSGMPLRDLVIEGFPLVRESARRSLGFEHHEVQLLAGLHLVDCHVIEMETGQGKTLTATLPLYLHALRGKGAHLATSNDYLAQRDAQTMAPVFQRLGLSCGFVVDQMPDSDRIRNYACDITYGTGTEFGFDFLRDRMKGREQSMLAASSSHRKVQRGLHFMLADEADSLLIDDANTPLVIGAAGSLETNQVEVYRWITSVTRKVAEGIHYRFLPTTKSIELTSSGRAWLRNELNLSGLDHSGSMLDLYQCCENAIWIAREFHRDKQYLVRDGEIVLINEGTGRLGEGRQLQEGLHQLVQAFEGLEVTPPSTHAARVTVQGFFLSYRHLAGMSGTVRSAKSEFRQVYKTPVIRIPTAQPSRRIELPHRWYATSDERWEGICDEIECILRQGRSVLVGTRSVSKSELLSCMLSSRGVSHSVLNAKCDATEADIIARAGEAGAVTVATGLAGRGTDIKPSEVVQRAGGLHVILSELHDSQRSDQQLFGRCARQGDPGSYRQFLSLDDEILDKAHGPNKAQALRRTTPFQSIPGCLYAAQRRLERRSRDARAEQLHSEKQKLKSFREMGLDPVLDTLA